MTGGYAGCDANVQVVAELLPRRLFPISIGAQYEGTVDQQMTSPKYDRIISHTTIKEVIKGVLACEGAKHRKHLAFSVHENN